MAIPAKPRKCRVCRESFRPKRCLQQACSFECECKLAELAAAKSKAKREKDCRVAEMASRKVIKAKLIAMKPKSYWWKIARRWFNAAIRARDEGKECISCDTILIKSGKPGGDYDAGHRRSVGSAKHLEFDPRNVHGQCKYCNDRLAGNPDAYNAKLPSRIGQEAFDALMCDQEPRNLTISDYKAIVESSKQFIRELKNG